MDVGKMIVGLISIAAFLIVLILATVGTQSRYKEPEWITYTFERIEPMKVYIWHNDETVSAGVYDPDGVIQWRGEKLSEEEKAEVLRRFLGLD